MVGIDTYHVQYQINNLVEHGETVYDNVFKTIDTFVGSLKENWYSPKAAGFNAKISKIVDAANDLYCEYYNIAYSVTEAYNRLAIANGLIPIESKKMRSRSGDSFSYALVSRSALSEIVGMNTNAVKEALVVFGKNVDKIIQLIDETPDNIAIFDEQGRALAVFKTEITKMKERLVASFYDVEAELSAVLNEEIQNVEAAKKEAIQELQDIGPGQISK